MVLEARFVYARLAAMLACLGFMTSQAVLCRPQWVTARVVRRFGRVDRNYWGAAAAVVIAGVARTSGGVKKFGWHAGPTTSASTLQRRR